MSRAAKSLSGEQRIRAALQHPQKQSNRAPPPPGKNPTASMGPLPALLHDRLRKPQAGVKVKGVEAEFALLPITAICRAGGAVRGWNHCCVVYRVKIHADFFAEPCLLIMRGASEPASERIIAAVQTAAIYRNCLVELWLRGGA